MFPGVLVQPKSESSVLTVPVVTVDCRSLTSVNALSLMPVATCAFDSLPEMKNHQTEQIRRLVNNLNTLKNQKKLVKQRVD